MSTNGKEEGIVKWFSDAKGYGFISPAGGRKDIFVHYSDIMRNGTERRSLAEGDMVMFELGASAKGPKAVNVEVCRPA